MGMLVNDIQLHKLLEQSTKAKERFKQIQDIQSFDTSPAYYEQESVYSQSNKMTIKESQIQLDKKINMLRLTKGQLKTACVKKFENQKSSSHFWISVQEGYNREDFYSLGAAIQLDCIHAPWKLLGQYSG